MIHPGGGIKAWSLNVSGQPWKVSITPNSHGVSSGRLASDPAWSFPLLYPVSSLLIPQCWPQSTPDTHPSTKLHPSLHPRESACIYQKTFQHSGRIFIWKLLVTYIIITLKKTPNKIQNVRNNDFLCECGYLWFKIHNLMLSDQMKLSYMLITKENYMLNHMKLPLYHL